jgi:predicted kinase
MLIVLSGLPATGKTALAAAVARELGAVLLSVDPVDAALAAAGIRDTGVAGLASYAVVGALAEQNLGLGATVVADAVNAVGEAKTFWIELARRRGARLLAIETILSDGDLHRERLAGRVRDLGIPEPTWEAVVLRRDEWVAWPFAPLVVDSAEPRALNGARVLEAVRMIDSGGALEAPVAPSAGHNETPEGTSGP